MVLSLLIIIADFKLRFYICGIKPNSHTLHILHIQQSESLLLNLIVDKRSQTWSTRTKRTRRGKQSIARWLLSTRRTPARSTCTGSVFYRSTVDTARIACRSCAMCQTSWKVLTLGHFGLRCTADLGGRYLRYFDTLCWGLGRQAPNIAAYSRDF